MADLYIPFTGPMVRALLAGTKFQTRRPVKPQPIVQANGAWRWEGRNGGFVGAMGTHVDDGFPQTAAIHARYQPGDRLWVREAWRVSKNYDALPPRDLPPRKMTVLFEAGGSIANQADGHWRPSDYEPEPKHAGWVGRYRPGMFLPRWASRLTLTVTDVRVERLQDISEEDAIAEGVERLHHGWFPYGISTFMTMVVKGREVPAQCCRTAHDSYLMLWNAINGPGAWEDNPWVAAYTFTVAHQNIDEGKPCS
ncbi:hypothetical protein [Kaistia sp. MMO-174]|uniref:hypothetical protein n=1 Tax=Kaistia sp. MMO-174 TaxID=3081256 RepID=UPI00301AB092